MTTGGLAAIVLAVWFIRRSRADRSGPIRRVAVQWLAMPVVLFGGPWLVFRATFGAAPAGTVVFHVCEAVLMLAGGLLAYASQIVTG